MHGRSVHVLVYCIRIRVGNDIKCLPYMYTRGQVRGVIVVLEMVVVRVVWGVEYWVIKSTR